MTTSRAPAIAIALAFACLALAAFLFVDTTRARRDAGFWRVTSWDADCARDPSWRVGPRTLVPEPFHAELLEQRDEPASARCDVYRGYLAVREPSRLSLELHASGSARVVFGKQELIALDVGSVRITRRVERPLPPGSHLLEVRTEQVGQLAYLRLSALVEPEEDVTTTPLTDRALLPLDHDALAPSQVDADRVRTDGSFARRTAPRLALFLIALLGLLLVPFLGRSLSAMRSGWPSVDARLAVLASLALVSVLGWLAWSPTTAAIDPHHVAHGARAWRTVWLSIPTRTFVDAIPALGVTEWSLGAAHALGGHEGPPVLAIVVAALTIASFVGAARLLDGVRGASITLIVLVAANVAGLPPSLGRGEMAGLALAFVGLVLAWLLSRSRLGAMAARLARRGTRARTDPTENARFTHARARPLWLAFGVGIALVAIGLGAPTSALAPLVLTAAVIVIACARDGWTERV